MSQNRISLFALERYRLGELNEEDEKIVTETLASGEELAAKLKALEQSDEELRLRYPVTFFNETVSVSSGRKEARLFPTRANSRRRLVTRITGIAALALFCLFLPVAYYLRSHTGVNALPEMTAANRAGIDRAKGTVLAGSELSLYLKEDRENSLQDKALLREGSTVQLAYTAPEGEHYGVIFSIDGRSIVTMHYPYNRGQSSLLVSGRRTLLEEAYTLDDAPDYEVFVFIISTEPVEVNSVLRKAQTIEAVSSGNRTMMMDEKIRTAFEDYEVEIKWVLKN